MAKNIPSLAHIGTVEKIGLPAYGLTGVPAKVDTGADGSAIWASDLHLDPESGLSFKLFGPGSRFYTGEEIAARTFRSVSVKNSFGVAESRYKVQLTVTIGERKIKAWFSLSDRADMKYPVLIGRRLLKNKFLVDVSRKHVHAAADDKKQVLVLGAPEHRVSDFFINVAGTMTEPTEFTARSLSELVFWIEPGNIRIKEAVTGRDLTEFDLVYFKTHKRYYEFAIAAAEYLKFHHMSFFDREISSHIAYDKLAEAMSLAISGVSVPPSVCGSSKVLRQQVDEIVDYLSLPLVIKEINADRGRKNYLVSSKAELLEVLEGGEPGDIFMAQKFIENDGYLRVLVLGSDPELVVKRSLAVSNNPRTRHLNNPSGSANAEMLDLGDVPIEVLDLAGRAARIMHRQIAGVDMAQDIHDKKWYILEVNTAPQIRSGSHVEAKVAAIARFFDKELSR